MLQDLISRILGRHVVETLPLPPLEQYLVGRNPEGCTDEEVAELESKFNVQFPSEYREFLLRAGRGADGLWVGSDYRFGILPEMQEWGRELLEEAGSGLEMPKGAFVILMHQGYQFFCINAEGVYYFHEGHQAIVKEFDSFTAFFEVLKKW